MQLGNSLMCRPIWAYTLTEGNAYVWLLPSVLLYVESRSKLRSKVSITINKNHTSFQLNAFK